MKFISILTSFVFFFNLAWGQSPSTEQIIQIENKLQVIVGDWNQASSYSQLLNRFANNPIDKKFLKDLLKKTRMERVKPPKLEYWPRQNKLVLSKDKESLTLWTLELGPNVVLYDGQKVKILNPNSKIKEVFKQEIFLIHEQLKKSNFKKVSVLKSIFLNSAFADQPEVSPISSHNAEIAKQLEQNKKNEKELTGFAKLIAMIFLGGLFLFPLFFIATNFVLEKAAPFYGPKKIEIEKEELEKTKANFPNISNELLTSDEVEIKSFECDAWHQIGYKGLHKVKYQIKSNLEKDNSQEENLNKSQEYEEEFGSVKTVESHKVKLSDNAYKKLQALDQCCKLFQCENWLKARLKDENKHKDINDFIRDKLNNK